MGKVELALHGCFPGPLLKGMYRQKLEECNKQSFKGFAKDEPEAETLTMDEEEFMHGELQLLGEYHHVCT